MNNNAGSIRESVREYYADQARSSSSCCGSSSGDCCGPSQEAGLYPIDLIATIPDDVAGFSLGCGDPISLAALQPGEIVLDLGSGGGLDCFLAARQVGESGSVIGVDMTPEMLARARGAAGRLGIRNVEFREGYLESLPRRKEAARTLRTLLDTLLGNGPERRVLVAGDLNDELTDPVPAQVLRVMNEGPGLADARLSDTCLYPTGPPPPGHFPGTLKYRGRWYEFDHILASGHFFRDTTLYIRPGSKALHRPAFLLEKDPAFPGDRPFRTYNGYRFSGGFSDHLPVYIDVIRLR